MNNNTMICNHSYSIGDVALSWDINNSMPNNDAGIDASSLTVGEPAFIRRSDKVWRYAIVSEVSPASIVFVVSPDGSTKTIKRCYWGDKVRPFKQRHSKRERLAAYLKEKGLRSSYEQLHSSHETLATISPADSQNSTNMESLANQVRDERLSSPSVTENKTSSYEPMSQRGGQPMTRRRESLKSKIIRRLSSGGDNTDNKPNTVLPVTHDESQPTPRQARRRESLKDKFIRKVTSSGGNPDKREMRREVSRHASDITNALQELGLDENEDRTPVITGDINCVQHNS